MPRLTPQPNGKLALLTAVLSFAAATAAAPQVPSPGAGQDPQRPVFSADVRLGTISVAVFDGDGLPIDDLAADDFRVLEDDVERPVAFASSAADAPLDVALVLDLSGSMGGSDWRGRTLGFLETLSPQRDCVLLLRFSRMVSTSVWGRPGDPELTSAIEDSRTGGATALYDALIEGVNRLAPFAAAVGVSGVTGAPAAASSSGATSGAPPAGSGGGCPAPPSGSPGDPSAQRRTAVIAVTDGFDSASGRGVHHVELASQATGVPIFQIELPAGGRSAVTMRRSAPRMSSGEDILAVGQQRRGGFGDGRQDLVAFQEVVSASGGDTFRAGPDAFDELIDRLRGLYLIAYQVPAPDRGTDPGEYSRHNLTVEIGSRRAKVLHRPVVYRPRFDQARAAAELNVGVEMLRTQDLEAARAAFDRSIAANPTFAAPHAWRAQLLLWDEGAEAALESALRAVALAPGNAEFNLIASDMALATERPELAWEHAIRAAQAGADTTFEFETLAEAAAAPADLARRLELPRIAVLAAPPSQPDLGVRAALPAAIRSIAGAVARSPGVALVPDPAAAGYVVWVRDEKLSSDLPRRFEGRLLLTDASGEITWQKGFRLNDVDDVDQGVDDLRDALREIADKIGG